MNIFNNKVCESHATIWNRSFLFSIIVILNLLVSIAPVFAQYYYPSPPPQPPSPPPDFSISTSSNSLTIQQGGSGSSTVTITPLNGFNSAVTFLVSGEPTSVKGFFLPNPATISGGGSTTLTVSVGSSTKASSYTLTLTAISGSITHTTTTALIIAEATPVAASAPLITGPSESLISNGTAIAAKSASPDMFNKAGNILVSDQFNNRVIEINPATKDIVWSFGSGNSSLCNPGPGAIIGPNDAERLSNGLTLIAGTGLSANASGSMPKGCVDNRVIVVNQTGQIVWQYGEAGVTGSGPNMLNVPVFAIQLPNGNFLITDQGNNRIIEVNQTKQIVWSYGPASGSGALNNPNSAELLPNGNILIADENNNRAIEITRDGNMVWQYDTGLQGVAFASRLPNGNTLIVDSSHSRILELNKQNDTVFQYFTNATSKSNPSPLPSNAVRLGNGEIIIADQVNERVIIIDSKGKTVFQYGKTNLAGVGPNELNWPYTAFVIGDYTGQTPPPTLFVVNPAYASTVPEFPFVIPILLIGITLLIVFRNLRSPRIKI